MTQRPDKHITIDHRERADELAELLETNYGFIVTRGQLELGDYLIPPDTLVERKTTADFAVSILDGRLFRQAYRLSGSEWRRPIIIIEGGSFQDRGGPEIDIAAVKGALISLAQTFHLPVLRTRSQADSAWHLNQLHRQRQRVGGKAGTLSSSRAKRLRTRKINMLRAVEGIGPKLAGELLDEFGTVTNVINARDDQLLEIRGLGRKTIDKLRQTVREERAGYHAKKH